MKFRLGFQGAKKEIYLNIFSFSLVSTSLNVLYNLFLCSYKHLFYIIRVDALLEFAQQRLHKRYYRKRFANVRKTHNNSRRTSTLVLNSKVSMRLMFRENNLIYFGERMDAKLL